MFFEHLGEFGHGDPARVPVGAAVYDHEQQVVVSQHAHAGAWLVALDGVVTEVGIDLNLVDAAHNLGVFDERRPEGEGVQHAGVNERLCAGAGFVVEFDAAVPVEGEPFTGGRIAVGDAVADDDAGVAEPVVVPVYGPDTVVLRGNIGGGVDNVLAEFVISEGGAQQRGIIEFHLGGERDDGVIAAAFGVAFEGDRAFLRGEPAVGDTHPGELGGVCGAGWVVFTLLRRLVGEGVFDLGVFGEVPVVGPASPDPRDGEGADAAADEERGGSFSLRVWCRRGYWGYYLPGRGCLR